MADSLPLSREFFSSCSDPAYNERRVYFPPKHDEYERFGSSYLYVSDNDVLEILVFRETIAQIVKECHPILRSYLHSRSEEATDTRTLGILYFMTVGMMLASHEHHTVINLHYDILMRIVNSKEPVFIDRLLDPQQLIFRELSFLQALLNSNNNKLNKSSSLWTLFKKLFVYCNDGLEKSSNRISTSFFMRTALTAAELHFSNYYAWNFQRFLNNVSKLQSTFQETNIGKIKEFAFSHHTDSAAWSCLTDCVVVNKESLELTCFEYNKLAKHNKIQVKPAKLLLLGLNSKELMLTISRWIWVNNVVSEVPYHALRELLVYNVKVWHEFDMARDLVGQAMIHCSILEEMKLRPLKIKIGDQKGYLSTNINIEEDYAFGQLLKTYFNWRRFVDWFDEFLKDKYVVIKGIDG